MFYKPKVDINTSDESMPAFITDRHLQSFIFNNEVFTYEQMRARDNNELEQTDVHNCSKIEQELAKNSFVLAKRDECLANNIYQDNKTKFDFNIDKEHIGQLSYMQKLFYKRYGIDSFEAELANFLATWFDESDFLEVLTSGSTGQPKCLLVKKSQMMQSAILTLSFLGITTKQTSLLCMPLKYIAGKMVVVRALVGRLNLIVVAPSGNPLKSLVAKQVGVTRAVTAKENEANLTSFVNSSNSIKTINSVTSINSINYINSVDSIDFAAMIPLQVYNSLQDRKECCLLKSIKHLIIGGGSIDQGLEHELRTFPYAVWSTYGMTETLSHIALRKLNGKDCSTWYNKVPQVTLSQDQDGALVIDAPLVNDKTLYTNDIVEFNEEGQFKIIGRKDNIINTGGIKVQIEKVEDELNLLFAQIDLNLVSIFALIESIRQKISNLTNISNTITKVDSFLIESDLDFTNVIDFSLDKSAFSLKELRYKEQKSSLVDQIIERFSLSEALKKYLLSIDVTNFERALFNVKHELEHEKLILNKHFQYAISSLPDPKFGESIVIVVEATLLIDLIFSSLSLSKVPELYQEKIRIIWRDLVKQTVQTILEHVLRQKLSCLSNPYAKAKYICFVNEIPKTETKKIARKQISLMLAQAYSEIAQK